MYTGTIMGDNMYFAELLGEGWSSGGLASIYTVLSLNKAPGA